MFPKKCLLLGLSNLARRPNFLSFYFIPLISRAKEIISKCGSREAIFYAVLGDHLDIVQTLLGDGPAHAQAQAHAHSAQGGRAGADPQYGYLIHLACRVGAYRSVAGAGERAGRSLPLISRKSLFGLLRCMTSFGNSL